MMNHCLASFNKLVALSLCMTISWSSCYQNKNQESEKESIAEAVFRYQFDHCRSDTVSQVYFLALGFNTDPNEKFMQRFIGSGQTVKKFSQSDYKGGLVTDRDTGERGIRISVTEVRLIGDKEAEVKGACFSMFGTIRDQVYSVIKENNKWIVKNAKNILDV